MDAFRPRGSMSELRHKSTATRTIDSKRQTSHEKRRGCETIHAITHPTYRPTNPPKLWLWHLPIERRRAVRPGPDAVEPWLPLSRRLRSIVVRALRACCHSGLPAGNTGNTVRADIASTVPSPAAPSPFSPFLLLVVWTLLGSYPEPFEATTQGKGEPK